MKVKLSIIILSYNTKELLRECLDSVAQSTKNIVQSEIIVVDNGSTDGSVEMLRKFKVQSVKLKVHLVENKENLGYAKGNNQGVRVAIGKYILFLNSDTIVENGAISKLVDYLETYSKAAAVSPLLLNKDGNIQKDPCYLKFPSPFFVFIYYNRVLKFITNNLFPGIIYSTQNFATPNEVDQLTGAALMIRKEVFDNVGGFEETFSHFFEDVDLSWRLKKAEYSLILVPEAKIIHLGKKSLEPKIKKEGIESFYFLNFKSLFRFCRKNYPPIKTTLIKMIVILHLLFRFRFNLVKKLYFR